jgi:hypothetical protein
MRRLGLPVIVDLTDVGSNLHDHAPVGADVDVGQHECDDNRAVRRAVSLIRGG